MFKWLRSLLKAPEPAGPPQTIKLFRISDPIITQGPISVEQDGWFIDSREQQTIRLFEVQNAGVQQCLLTYRARMKTDGLQGRAFLEMWCGVSGRGEFFSKGLNHPAKGTSDWTGYDVPFYLQSGQTADRIKLNLVVEGTGKIWIKDVELLQTPLKS